MYVFDTQPLDKFMLICIDPRMYVDIDKRMFIHKKIDNWTWKALKVCLFLGTNFSLVWV